MIIVGLRRARLVTTLMALSGNLGVVLSIAFGIGVANMVFIIPSQTLFQERTPGNLIGRVVGFRFALVFGAMTLAIGLGGVLAEAVGVTTVIAGFRAGHRSSRSGRVVRASGTRGVIAYRVSCRPPAAPDARPATSSRSDDTPVTEPRDRAPDDDLDADIDDEGVDDERADLDRETDVDDLDDRGVDAIDDKRIDGDEEVEPADAEIDDYEAAVREISGDAAPAATATAAERRSSAARRRTPAKQAARAPSPSEVAVHVRENVSAFVIAAVAVYIVILLNGIFLGTGGVFRPLPTPTPTSDREPEREPERQCEPERLGRQPGGERIGVGVGVRDRGSIPERLLTLDPVGPGYSLGDGR